MKKVIIAFACIAIISIAVFFNWYTNSMQEKRLVESYNNGYEIFTEREITGVDITTIINKAIDNNEQNSIPKDESGLYIEDNRYSTQVYIKVSDEYYPMEAFEKVGINTFARAYGSAKFKCVEKTYNQETGRISKLFFEIIK